MELAAVEDWEEGRAQPPTRVARSLEVICRMGAGETEDGLKPRQEEFAAIRDPGLRGSMAAMQRAALAARETAIRTDTAIVVVRDGKPVRISAAQLRAGEE